MPSFLSATSPIPTRVAAKPVRPKLLRFVALTGSNPNLVGPRRILGKSRRDAVESRHSMSGNTSQAAMDDLSIQQQGAAELAKHYTWRKQLFEVFSVVVFSALLVL